MLNEFLFKTMFGRRFSRYSICNCQIVFTQSFEMTDLCICLGQDDSLVMTEI